MNDEPRRERGALTGLGKVSLVGDNREYTAQPHTLQESKIARQFGYGRELASVVAGMAYGSIPETWRSRL